LPGSIAFDPAKEGRYPFDLDKAKSLLTQAGVTGPLEFEMIGSVQTPDQAALGQIMQNDLAKIGIRITLKISEHAAYLAELNEIRYKGLSLGNAAYGSLELASMLTASRHFDPAGPASGFDSDRYRQLTSAAAAEPDRAKRKAIYSDLVELFIDESFSMPVTENRGTFMARPNVHGLAPSKHGVFHSRTSGCPREEPGEPSQGGAPPGARP
jgi:peptide/nickel transport system substrate-binding protein